MGHLLNPLKEPMHAAISESSPLTLEEQVQHIVVFVPPSDQLNYNYVNSLPHPPFPCEKVGEFFGPTYQL